MIDAIAVAIVALLEIFVDILSFISGKRSDRNDKN
jgi:hypothetical protein